MSRENEVLMVSIRCTVYNHEKYIRKTLDGFVMQKTNFRFEAIVHDDASTDGSAKIIQEYAEKYPDIIKPIYETENQYSKRDGSLHRIMNEACKGKYIAMCEGDDYWIDPLKLQKQVDILEHNPHVMMVYSNFQTVDELGHIIERPRYDNFRTRSRSGDVFRWLMEIGNFVMTLTTIYRKEVIAHPVIANSPVTLDYLYILVAAGLGDLFYLPDVTAAYRWVPTGQMNTNLKGVEDAINKIRFYICQNFVDGNFKEVSTDDRRFIKNKFMRDAFNLYRKKIDRNTLPNTLKKHPSLYWNLCYVILKYGIKKVYSRHKN